jgi:hypothetical protein
MPHFGLMSTKDSFDTEEGALLRSRIHIRAGKKKLLQGKISDGIVTFFDAFLFALRWYIASPERRKLLPGGDEIDRTDEKQIFQALCSSPVLQIEFDFDSFDALVEKALHEEMPDYDFSEMISGFEAFMIQLGVMPFDETMLPPEAPATF